MQNENIIVPKTFPMFGRDDEPVAEKYFALLNQFYLSMNRLENELISEMSDLNNGSQSSEDFEDDVISLTKSISHGKVELGRKLTQQRKKWGW